MDIQTEQPYNYRITLTATGDLPLCYEDDALAQDVAAAIRTIKGEYLFDETLGVDLWKGSQKGGAALLENEIKRVILGRPGVKAVNEWSVTFDKATRSWAVECIVIGTEGDFPFGITIGG
jgi:hypothetical protein